MTLPEIIAECKKLDTPYKATIINKLEVAATLLIKSKGTEHLFEAPKPPEKPPEPPKEEAKPKTQVKRRPADPMPEGG